MDFEARSYDPAIARWTSVDPVTHFNMSTYNAFDNNPVYFADPSGTTTVSSITEAWNATPEGESSTWNSDGEGGFCDDCPQEGQTRPEMQDRGRSGFVKTGGSEYYHSGGGGIMGDAGARWYSETEYFELFRPQIRAIGQGRASIESLHKYGFTDDVLEAMVGWALQAYDYYGGETPLARGNVNAMGFDSPVFILASLRIVGAMFLKSNTVINAPVTSGQLGKLIGWGEGQGAAAVNQTINVTKNLTKSQVRRLSKQGLTREWVEIQLSKYSNALNKGGSKLKNDQLIHRKGLMEKILDLWD